MSKEHRNRNALVHIAETIAPIHCLNMNQTNFVISKNDSASSSALEYSHN